MSEKAPQSPENQAQNNPESSHSALKPTEVLEHKELSSGEMQHMAKQASEKARDSSDIMGSINSEAVKEDTTPSWTSSRLQAHNFANIMRSTQRKLSLFDSRYSKIIHNSAVDKISEASSKTVARPTAFLFGALSSLIGSSFVIYFARRNGFEIKPIMFVLLFIGGYTVGMIFDLFFSSSKKITKR